MMGGNTNRFIPPRQQMYADRGMINRVGGVSRTPSHIPHPSSHPPSDLDAEIESLSQMHSGHDYM